MAFNQDPKSPLANASISGGGGTVVNLHRNEQAPTQAQAPAPVDDGTFVPPPPVEEPVVPKGTTKEVEAWVGDDKERAQLVLDNENAQEQPRKGLIRVMEELVRDGSAGSA